MGSLEENIKCMVKDAGADVCGIGSIQRFSKAPEGFSPRDLWEGCESVIAIGYALPKGVVYAQSRLIYSYFNGDACNILDRIALASSKKIEETFDCIAVPVPSDGPYEYWEAETMTGKGLLSMKHVGVQCGLGTLGKNDLLINPEYGNLLIIGAILTDLKLTSDPLCEPLCLPNCNKCIRSCPVHAIQKGYVNQLLCRTNTYGKTARGYDAVDCKQCRLVCPRRFGINE